MLILMCLCYSRQRQEGIQTEFTSFDLVLTQSCGMRLELCKSLSSWVFLSHIGDTLAPDK